MVIYVTDLSYHKKVAESPESYRMKCMEMYLLLEGHM